MTLLEKAAHALMEHHGVDPESYQRGLGGYRHYLDAARVIASVFAEPTEKMIDVGIRAANARGAPLRATTLAKCYEAMVAAILTE